MKIRISAFVHDSVVDGPGLRFVVFVQGCEHRCQGCHNKHTWSKSGGQVVDTDFLIWQIEKNPLVAGVTLSGGEPFLQAKKLLNFAKQVKERNLELAIYSGYLFEDLIKDDDKKELLCLADILVDGPFILSQHTYTKKFTGSSNQRIIDVQKSIKSGKVVLSKDERWV